MNNQKINKIWRRAISYAINYTYIVEELQDGTVFRSNGPLAPDYPGYNKSIVAPTMNLAKARQILKNANIPGTSGLVANNDTTGPVAEAWKAANLTSFNYSYIIGDDFREDLLILLRWVLDQIGITLIGQGMTYSDFVNRTYGNAESGGYGSLEFYLVNLDPDFLDPYNIISKLCGNNSQKNAAQYHNHQVNIWLEDAIREINRTKRFKLYSKILHQMVEEDMPYVFLYHNYKFFYHVRELKGVPSNAMSKLYIYPIYRKI